MMRTARIATGVGVLLLLAGCQLVVAEQTAPRSEAAPLHEAMDGLTDVVVYDIFSPPQGARLYAYASIAAYEAARHADTSYRSLAGQVNGLDAVPAPPAGELSYPLASVRAFLTVGHQFTFSRDRMDSVGTRIVEGFRRSGMPDSVFERSVAYGDTVARHVLAWAATDGFGRSRGLPKYTVTADPARWIPTPPAYMDAVEPNWHTLRPFTLDSASQFRPEPPFPFDSTPGSPFHQEALEVYEASLRLTEQQREITAFWDCNPYVMHVQGHTMFATKKISPGGHWMGITGLAARRADLGIVASAEAYALAAMALSDGFVSSWEEKFRSDVVRPETYINRYVDEGWQPILQTPPFPEYTSGHSVISTAAAAVLTHLFGDGFAYEDSSEVDYGLPVRSYASFEQAAAEAAISRLYGGIHYRRAVEQGVVQGRRIGEHQLRRVATRPSRDRPTVTVARVSAGATAPAEGAPRREGASR